MAVASLLFRERKMQRIQGAFPLISSRTANTGTPSIRITQLHDVDTQTQNTIATFFPGTMEDVQENLDRIAKKIEKTIKALGSCESEKDETALKERLADLERKQYLLTLQHLHPENPAEWAADIADWVKGGIRLACLAQSAEFNTQKDDAIGFTTLALFTEPSSFGAASIYVSRNHPDPAHVIRSLIAELEFMASARALPKLLVTTTDATQANVLKEQDYREAGILGSRTTNGAQYMVWQKRIDWASD